jgi:hypothetical protein
LDEEFDKRKTEFEDRLFLKGAEGQEAAKSLTELKEKYRQAKDYIVNRDFYEGNPDISRMIAAAHENKNADELQEHLDIVLDKDAYWHYIQSVVFYIKRLNYESLRHLKRAVQMAPQNDKYSEALFRLGTKILTEENGL